MKKAVKWFGMLAFVAAIGFSFVTCDAVGLGGGGSGGGNIDLTGTWQGEMSGYTATVTLTSNRWTADIPFWGYENGTYTRRGNTVTFYYFDYDYGRDIEGGTGVIIDNNTVRVTVNSGSEFDGTVTMYRVR